MTTDRLSYDRKEAAKAVGVGIDVITTAIRTGALKAKRSGVNDAGDGVGKYLIRRVDLESWFDGLVDA